MFVRLFFCFFAVYSLSITAQAEEKNLFWSFVPHNFKNETLQCIRCAGNSGSELYVGTCGKVYFSKNNGNKWEEIFRVTGEERTVNDIFVDGRGFVFISTANGLFRLTNDRSSYEKLIKSAVSGEKNILSFVNDGDKAFLLTPTALYLSMDNLNTWKKIYEKAAPETALAQEEGEELDRADIFRKLAVYGPVIYLSTGRGIYMSSDSGATWAEPATRDTLPKEIRSIRMANDGSRSFIATGKGIFVYERDLASGKPVYTGLLSLDMKDICVAPNGTVFCISASDIYKGIDREDAVLAANPDAFAYEPSIIEVQKMAIEYAEVSPDKIKAWRRQSQIKAILPSISFGIDHDTSDTYEIYTASNNNYAVTGPKDNSDGWDVRLTWDLGDLIYNDAQTSIDVRSKLMVELRDDILNDVNRIYFERRRLQMELMACSKDQSEILWDKKLRVDELTASLDALTGGRFSEAISSDTSC